jgi:hypothetical protein
LLVLLTQTLYKVAEVVVLHKQDKMDQAVMELKFTTLLTLQAGYLIQV